MKKGFLFFTATFLFLAFHSNAQIFTAKAGFNLANVRAENYMDGVSNSSDMNPGFHLGMMVDFPINSRFSVGSGLMINNRGSKGRASDATSEAVFTSNQYYLDLPLTGKLNQPIGKATKAFAVAGPYMALGLLGLQTTKYTSNGSTEKETSNIHWWDGNTLMKKFEVGATFGLGVERKSMQYSFSYDLGLTKLVDLDGLFWSKNRVIRFSIGYRFGKKFQKTK